WSEAAHGRIAEDLSQECPTLDQGPVVERKMMMRNCRAVLCSISLLVMSAACCAQAGVDKTEISNGALTVSLRNKVVIYEVRAQGLESAVFSSRIGAEVDHQWLWSTEYPQSHVDASEFRDQLGSGHRLEVTFPGSANKPELKYTVELYDQLPFGDVQVQLE